MAFFQTLEKKTRADVEQISIKIENPSPEKNVNNDLIEKSITDKIKVEVEESTDLDIKDECVINQAMKKEPMDPLQNDQQFIDLNAVQVKQEPEPINDPLNDDMSSAPKENNLVEVKTEISVDDITSPPISTTDHQSETISADFSGKGIQAAADQKVTELEDPEVVKKVSCSACSRLYPPKEYHDHILKTHASLFNDNKLVHLNTIFPDGNGCCALCRDSLRSGIHYEHYKCKHCDFYGPNATYINQHIAKKHKKDKSSNNIRCLACSGIYPRNEYYDHILKTHAKLFPNNKLVHLNTIFPDGKGRCALCQGSLSSGIHYEHYKCKHCDVYGPNATFINLHAAKKHNKDDPNHIRCSACLVLFPTIEYRDHILKTHGKFSTNNKLVHLNTVFHDGKGNCALCQGKLSFGIHHEHYKCKHCDEYGPDATYINEHTAQNHNNFCTICKEHTVQKLTDHMKSPHYSCPDCRIFKCESKNLKLHILETHTSENLVKLPRPPIIDGKCVLCDVHESTAETEIFRKIHCNHFACPMCSFCSVTKSDLEHHIFDNHLQEDQKDENIKTSFLSSAEHFFSLNGWKCPVRECSFVSVLKDFKTMKQHLIWQHHDLVNNHVISTDVLFSKKGTCLLCYQKYGQSGSKDLHRTHQICQTCNECFVDGDEMSYHMSVKKCTPPKHSYKCCVSNCKSRVSFIAQ